MKVEKLAKLEDAFLQEYPDGFDSPDLLAIGKKHKMGKMQEFVEAEFNEAAFTDVNKVFESFVKLISKASLVSVFEKTKFRNIAPTFTMEERTLLVEGLKEFLYGDQATGFSMQVDVLTRYKMAKWPILTVLGLYMHPGEEVLVKPTTVKGILKYFEVEDFTYTSKANYEFYAQYRQLVNDIKEKASERLDVDNAAFCGFLMMSIQEPK